MPIEKRYCQCCAQALHGRLDKKFCDDGCRNTFNNQQNSNQNKEMRLINSILKKNRFILLSKLTEGRKQVKISRDQLILAGFNFNYMTHFSILPTGLSVQFCYEFGWVVLEKNYCLIVHH